MSKSDNGTHSYQQYDFEAKTKEDLDATEIEIAETDEERLNAYYRLGAVQEMYLENYDEAVNCYNEMHMIVTHLRTPQGRSILIHRRMPPTAPPKM